MRHIELKTKIYRVKYNKSNKISKLNVKISRHKSMIYNEDGHNLNNK